jgi:hypothetical protein
MCCARVWVGVVVVLACAVSQPAEATPIAVGLISFDTFIPGPGGTDAFFVSNLTGDPSAGGSALPPDFPVVTFLTFDSPLISWSGPTGSPFDFGGVGLGPGSHDPDPQIQFPDTTQLFSATFTAMLRPPSFQLADGRWFTTVSPAVTATLTDPSGALVPGDFVLLSVDAHEVINSAVPEPASLALLACGLTAYGLRRRRKSP